MPQGRSRVPASDQTNTQGLKVTEDNLLLLLLHPKIVRHSIFSEKDDNP